MQIPWLFFFKQSNKQTDEPGQLCNLLDVWNSRNKKQLTITFCSYLQNQNVCLFVLIFACSSGRSPRRNRSLLHLTFLLCFPIRSRNVKDVCFLHELISASWQCFSISVKQLLDFTLWWFGHLSRCTPPSDQWQLGWAQPPCDPGLDTWLSKWMEWWIWWVFLLFCLSPV